MGDIDVQVVASDGNLSVTKNFIILVVDANNPPVLVNNIADQSIDTNDNFSLNSAFYFSDADGDALGYTATLADGSPLPDWLNFDVASKTFSGTTVTADYLGRYDIKIIAAGSMYGLDMYEFSINVLHATNTLSQPVTIVAHHSGGIVQGSDDADGISGSNNGDTIYSGAGDDAIYGYAGDDTIYSGIGTNTINGGAGNDSIHLYRNSTSNTIIYDSILDGIDTIAGFGTSNSVIDLSNVEIDGVGLTRANLKINGTGGDTDINFYDNSGNELQDFGIKLIDLNLGADVVLDQYLNSLIDGGHIVL